MTVAVVLLLQGNAKGEREHRRRRFGPLQMFCPLRSTHMEEIIQVLEGVRANILLPWTVFST